MYFMECVRVCVHICVCVYGGVCVAIISFDGLSSRGRMAANSWLIKSIHLAEVPRRSAVAGVFGTHLFCLHSTVGSFMSKGSAVTSLKPNFLILPHSSAHDLSWGESCLLPFGTRRNRRSKAAEPYQRRHCVLKQFNSFLCSGSDAILAYLFAVSINASM